MANKFISKDLYMYITTFKELETLELLKMHAMLMDELRSRGVLRTMNNPVAGYAEYLVCKALSLTPARNSEKGFDAIGVNEKKIRDQIKKNHLKEQNH